MTEFKTDWNDYPTCPYCGMEDQDYRDIKLLGFEIKDGSEWITLCPECNKKYQVTAYIDWQFLTEGKEI